jgi:hypothetical protein
VPSPSSTELLKRALTVQPSQAKLATALGMNRSRLNRVFNGATLGISNCLKLATLIDELPHVVLRAWGYQAEAASIERAYVPPRLTVRQIEVAERFGKATPKRKRLVLAVLDDE